MTYDTYNQTLLALTMWREAHGEGTQGMYAVGCVIRNRVGTTNKWATVITAKWQFSSLTAPGDPMLIQWPQVGDIQWEESMKLAGDIYTGQLEDITNGATHYFNPNVVLPSWASKMTKVASIGHHDFYKQEETNG